MARPRRNRIASAKDLTKRPEYLSESAPVRILTDAIMKFANKHLDYIVDLTVDGDSIGDVRLTVAYVGYTILTMAKYRPKDTILRIEINVEDGELTLIARYGEDGMPSLKELAEIAVVARKAGFTFHEDMRDVTLRAKVFIPTITPLYQGAHTKYFFTLENAYYDFKEKFTF